MMKKILYIVSTLIRSGPNNQFYGMVSNLDRNKFEPHIVTFSPEPENSRYDDFEKTGAPIKSFNRNRLAGMFFNRSDLVHEIRRCQPDIIHTQGFRADVVLSKVKIHCPWITTIHNDPCVDFPLKFGRMQGNWMARKHIRAVRKATVPVCCSETVGSVFREKYKVQHVRAVQNGVDTEKYRPLEVTQREKLREKFGFIENDKVFLSVSSLVKRKDVKTLIHGFQMASIENFRLIILGDGPERAELETVAQSASNIDFLGSVTNVHEYLSAADGLISASLSEGLPCSVLEAIASGLPVILSDIPSHREILKSDQTLESFLFPTQNESRLADALQSMVKVDFSEVSARVRAIAEENFSSEMMSKKYQSIYAECIRTAGG